MAALAAHVAASRGGLLAAWVYVCEEQVHAGETRYPLGGDIREACYMCMLAAEDPRACIELLVARRRFHQPAAEDAKRVYGDVAIANKQAGVHLSMCLLLLVEVGGHLAAAIHRPRVVVAGWPRVDGHASSGLHPLVFEHLSDHSSTCQ
ncbi:hypothetical protein Dimus_017464 [Dionaea muscipula]